MTYWTFTDASIQTLPVGTLYCIGRNYADHAAEMGAPLPAAGTVADPIVFLKPPTAYRPTCSSITLPSFSTEIHHEVELVVVMGVDGIAGIGVGLDLTARDLQAAAKAKGLPWSTAKSWKGSAPVSPIAPWGLAGGGPWQLTLHINGEVRQQASTALMERSIDQLVAYVDDVFGLQPGDAMFTGTPAGVAAVRAGDRALASLDDLCTLEVRFE
jgi:2-keto-4-pentenoate hydratase/2-oxohepta-3-ene-1,7-dioic acid hydratase in catechol pathway